MNTACRRHTPVHLHKLLPCWWQRQAQQADSPQQRVGQQLQQAGRAAAHAQHQHNRQPCSARLQAENAAAAAGSDLTLAVQQKRLRQLGSSQTLQRLKTCYA
jgi:hypothetical protein